MRRCSVPCRYKPLCPDTWPNWKGTAAEGVKRLVSHLGYKRDEYKMGRYDLQQKTPATPTCPHMLSRLYKDVYLSLSRTKIFIRHPRTLFATEDAFQVCKHKLGEVLSSCHSNATLSSRD